MHRRTKNENDMEKVSRSIFYKEKESLRLFLGKEDSLERDFLDKLRKRPFMQNLDDASVNILRLFNNACYICTLVYEDEKDYPLLELNKYEKIAIDNHDDPIWTNHMFPATMALVVCWLRSGECRKISEERGRQKDIEELCKGICVNIEECSALPNESIEDFHALISHENRHPSEFIEEKSFLRRPLAEVVEDKSVKGNEVLDSMKYLADIIKNNPDEFLIAFGPDSYFNKQLSKMSFNETEMKSRLADWCKNKSDDSKKEPTVIEQAYMSLLPVTKEDEVADKANETFIPQQKGLYVTNDNKEGNADKGGRPESESLDELFTEACSPAQLKKLIDYVGRHKGKKAVFAFKVAALPEVGIIKQVPSYSKAKERFPNIGAESNYYRQIGNSMTDDDIEYYKRLLT